MRAVTNLGEDHAPDVAPGDGPVNVADDDLLISAPHEGVTAAPGRALELGGHTKQDRLSSNQL